MMYIVSLGKLFDMSLCIKNVIFSLHCPLFYLYNTFGCGEYGWPNVITTLMVLKIFLYQLVSF